jgi:hypothetical protein
MGDDMRLMSVVKVALLAGAVALPGSFAVASAKTAPLPPGACAFEKKGVIANAAICSYNCDPATSWCSQQLCVNGTLTPVLSCYGGFCTTKCGG